jgi:hypothetical protein
VALVSACIAVNEGKRRTSHDSRFVSRQRCQLLTDLHNPTLDSSGNGETRGGGGLTLEDVRDRYPQRRLKGANGDVERVCKASRSALDRAQREDEDAPSFSTSVSRSYHSSRLGSFLAVRFSPEKAPTGTKKILLDWKPI